MMLWQPEAETLATFRAVKSWMTPYAAPGLNTSSHRLTTLARPEEKMVRLFT
jgi:hypothetical protein